MILKINRYNLKEVERIRITKANASKTLEIDVTELLDKQSFPEMDDGMQMISHIRDLQTAIAKLKNYKDLMIEIDFIEEQ